MFKRVAVHNFKSIANVNVELDPLTILIGRSGSGKSAFVRAIRWLRDTLRNPSAANADPWLPSAGVDVEFFGCEVEFILPDRQELFLYKLTYSVSPEMYGSRVRNRIHGVEEEHFSVDGRLVFDRSQVGNEIDTSTPALGQLWGINAARLAFSALRSGIGVYDFPLGIFSAGEDEGGRDDTRNFGLADDGDNAGEILAQLAYPVSEYASFDSLVSSLNALIPFRSFSIKEHSKTFDVVQHFRRGRVSLPIGEQSEGFRRLLAHLLAIYQFPRKNTLVFEEPEKGVYPKALSVLADECKAAAETGRCQVLITTHSPQLLDYFPAENIRVVTTDRGATEIGKVSEDQLAGVRDHLLTTGELLTVDEARPTSARRS